MPDAEGRAAQLPDLAAIRAAHARIAPYVHRTPVLRCSAIDDETRARLYFKCENFQKVGAFKARGATNAVFSLPEAEAGHGVVAHSSGNHGAALAYAARQRGIAAWVVMPENSAKVKQDNVRRFGATIRFCAPNIPANTPLSCRAIRVGPLKVDTPMVLRPLDRRRSTKKYHGKGRLRVPYFEVEATGLGRMTRVTLAERAGFRQ